MTRTYDVLLYTRIPNARDWEFRTFRVYADREFTAIEAAVNVARKNYLTSRLNARAFHVPTLASRINDFFSRHAYSFAATNKSEIVAGGPYGLRGLVYRFARRFL